MLRVGITGGIGSGKSVVAKILETKGFPVFYSDKEAKDIVHSNKKIQQEIIDLIGRKAYIDGRYNRSYVAKKVFSDRDLLEKLNQIIHPAVRRAYDGFCESSKASFVFNEAAILFETGANKLYDKVILVCSPMELRLERLIARDGSTKEEIQTRINKQWSDVKKRELTELVIENNEVDSILEQIDQTLASLNRH